MSRKKQNARLKRQKEEAHKASQQTYDKRRGTPFTNYSTGIIFILAGIICAACLIAAAVYMDFSGGKAANMIVLALMSAYFLAKAPAYLKEGRKMQKEKKGK